MPQKVRHRDRAKNEWNPLENPQLSYGINSFTFVRIGIRSDTVAVTLRLERAVSSRYDGVQWKTTLHKHSALRRFNLHSPKFLMNAVLHDWRN
jgi:hypothetical protein